MPPAALAEQVVDVVPALAVGPGALPSRGGGPALAQQVLCAATSFRVTDQAVYRLRRDHPLIRGVAARHVEVM
ncbi:hypothetical protein GCM10023205_73910 [Yinghuangia aomiensis]|uniref:Uncharacterized protein n=1 Tax=Yinghuangia aomiensis TaxID=676205 RepID=A0ABP9I9A5_9ACTN